MATTATSPFACARLGKRRRAGCGSPVRVSTGTKCIIAAKISGTMPTANARCATASGEPQPLIANRELAIRENRLRLAVATNSGDDGKVDHDSARLALLVLDAQVRTIAILQLGEQRQGIVVVAETHGFAGLQGVERTEDGGVAEALGDTAGVERIEGFGSRAVAGMNVMNLHMGSGKNLPGWQSDAILPVPFFGFLDPHWNTLVPIRPFIHNQRQCHLSFPDCLARSSARRIRSGSLARRPSTISREASRRF